MPATEVTQSFFEAKPLWVGKVGAAGVASAVATNIPIQSAANLTNGNAYIVTVNRTDAAGTTKHPANERETFIGKLSSTTFINCTRGVEGEAQAWEADTVLEILATAVGHNKLIEGIEQEHGSDGKHKIDKLDAIRYAADAGASDAYTITLSPSPTSYYEGMTVVFKANTANTGVCTLDVNGLGAKTIKKLHDQDLADSDIEANQIISLIYDGTNFQLQSQIANSAVYLNNSMPRQAIINGNFDVAQAGTSLTNPVDSNFLSDEFKIRTSADAGTLPTIIHSVQEFTPGELLNSKYFYRINTNGSGISLGVNSYGFISQFIENGVVKLCGLNKKVTVSFWARSSIAGKRFVPNLQQIYGTGGSPSATENILGTPITLTSTLTKYTVTFTTNTLVGKTFGTNNNDSLCLNLWYMWGATIGNTAVSAGISAETYVGSGNIDIAQVQLCAGDVALPFMPKSYEEELRACQRGCQVFTSKNTFGAIAMGSIASATTLYAALHLITPMRTFTSLVATASDFKANSLGGSLQTVTSIAVEDQFTSDRILVLAVGVASGLTGNCGFLLGNGVGKKLIIRATL